MNELYYNSRIMENATVNILSYWEAILKWFSECSTRQYKDTMNEESDDHRWYYRWYWIERIITSDIERWKILRMSKAINIELEEKWYMKQLWSVIQHTWGWYEVVGFSNQWWDYWITNWSIENVLKYVRWMADWIRIIDYE